MGDGFDPKPVREDDYPGMLAAIERRLERRTIARVIGVRERQLDLLAIGHAPNADVGDRLRLLFQLAQTTEGDLDDQDALLLAAHAATLDGPLMLPVYRVPRLRVYAIAVASAVIVLWIVGTVLFLRG